MKKTFIVDIGTENEFVITKNSDDIKIVINNINEVLFNFAEFINSNTTMLDSDYIMIDLSKVEDDLMLNKIFNRYLKEYCLKISIISITKQLEENIDHHSYENTLEALEDIDEMNNPTLKFSDTSLSKFEDVKEVAKETGVSIDAKPTSEKPKKKYKKHNRNNDPYYHQGKLGYNWFHLQHSSVSGPNNW